MERLRDNLGEIAFWGLLVASWLAGGWAFFHYIVEPGRQTLVFQFQGRTLEILEPLFFGGLLAVPLLWLIQRWTLSDLPRLQRWLNVALRSLVLVALVGALVQVVLTTFESRITTVFLVDTSASVPDEVLDEAVDYVNRAREAQGEYDQIRVVGFAKHPYRVPVPESGPLETIPRPEDEDDRLYTDIAAALRMSYGLFPNNHLKRVVLLSDGNQTRGELLGEAHRAENFGIRLYQHEIEYEPKPEVMIRKVDAPENLEVGAPFRLVARVFSTHETKATLTLWQNEYKSGTKTVDLQEGANEVAFETEVIEPGFREFKLEMQVQGRDHVEANNEYVYSTDVQGKPRVLYIEGEMRSRHYLQRALRNENFEVETRSKDSIPTTLKGFDQFDAVLLSDVSALHVSTKQMKLIDRYVRDLGGGFLMVGGEDSYGPGGYYGTYMKNVLPVKFQPKAERRKPSLALMLVIDKSGSMSGKRIELAKEAAKATVEILGKNDKVGVSAFDDSVQSIVRMQSAVNRVRILNDISRLQASGGTDIAAGLSQGFDKLSMTPAKLKHIILLSDGHSKPANIFSELLPAMRIENITVSTVAIGSQSATTLLRRIAEGGSGRYYFTSDPYNIPRIFMKETSTVSRNSMVEEPFRPKIVKQAQVLEGIPWDRAPYLLGYVSTQAKKSAEVLMVSEYGEPILARWRRGLGKVVAFTSDLKNRWAVQWVQWSGYAKFWSQLIRDTMRTDDRTRLPMRAEVERGEAKITVDAIGRDDRFINGLESKVTMTTPGGDKKTLELKQVAAGRYEATVPLDAYGSYHLKANHRAGPQTEQSNLSALSFGSLSYPYPREHLFLEPNRELLRQAAEAARGETNPSVETLFDPMGEEVKYRRELWPWFLVAALGLLVLDLLFRRVRLSRSTEVNWGDLVG
jgi:Mg-chelatase subunit ChlD